MKHAYFTAWLLIGSCASAQAQQASSLQLQRDAYAGLAQCFNTALDLEKKVATLEQKIKELEAKNAKVPDGPGDTPVEHPGVR